ncbi:MAG: transposase [Candidatus Saccharibacteria bacterium]|nr:transposase [Moraxellaceae bacterium]
MGRSRYKITDETAVHFVTCTVLHWLPVFTNQDSVGIVIDSLKFLQQEGIKIYAWVILENHLHLVIQSNNTLSKDLARFKRHTASKIFALLRERNATTLLDQFKHYKTAHKVDRELQFWQEGSHPELIANDLILRQKVEYIHQNPIKRGYVDQAEHWRYSSARSYLGSVGLLEISFFS